MSGLYLFGDSVPVKVSFTNVHPLLVQEFALVGNKEGVTYKLANCKERKMLTSFHLHHRALVPGSLSRKDRLKYFRRYTQLLNDEVINPRKAGTLRMLSPAS